MQGTWFHDGPSEGKVFLVVVIVQTMVIYAQSLRSPLWAIICIGQG